MQYYLHVVLPGVSTVIRLHGDAKSTATTNMLGIFQSQYIDSPDSILYIHSCRTLSFCYKPKLDVELDHN